MTASFSDIFRLSRLIASRFTVYLLMVVGLSLGYGVATVIILYAQNELNYDRSLPGADKVYLLSATYGPQGRPLVSSDVTPAGVARWIRTDAAEVTQVARLNPVEWPMQTRLRKVKERFYWADENIFSVLKLPVLHGDLKTALRDPDTVVMTRKMALAYFGRDDVIGQSVAIKNNQKLRVTAVLKDFPANTHLEREIFASGKGSYAMISIFESNPMYLWPSCYTYVTLQSQTSTQSLARKLGDISRRHWEGDNNLPEGFELVPLLKLHFRAHGDGQMKVRGHFNSVLTLGAVAAALLALASINVSGLVLAESNQRSAEMALRSALGARRLDLIAGILRETFSVHAVSVLIGLAMTERLLPWLNTRLDLSLTLWRYPVSLLLMLSIIGLAAAFLSGLYPALIVSQPYAGRQIVLKPRGGTDVSERWRGWVVAQLSLVIVLLIASHTLSRQWTFATRQALHFNGDNVLMIRMGEDVSANAAFRKDLAALPGVEAVAESWGVPTVEFVRPGWIRQDKGLVAFTRNSVAPDFFKVYGVSITAGRNLTGTYLFPEAPKDILINASAVRALGFGSAQAALGKSIDYETDQTTMRSRVIGVVPDVRFATVYEPTPPMIFDNFSKYFTQWNVRISAGSHAETLRAIDALWSRDTADVVPIDRRFYRDYQQEQYHDLHQQMQVFNLVSAAAVILSTLGLTGLSIFLTRHQVREVAIHRALGATFTDIFLFRLRPFFRPFLIANLIGWPLAWLCLRTWLNAFADQIGLSLWSFLGAGAASFVFALVTVAVHSALTARKVSVAALRHT